MNLSYYISQRIARSSTSGYSGTIIKIAIATIGLSVAAMILSISVLLGFKNGISEKVFGFWGHIHITDSKISRTLELTPIENSQIIKDSIASIGGVEKMDDRAPYSRTVKSKGGVKSINPYIMMPGIISTKNDLEGIILKGINEEYDWENFKSYLKEGKFPELSGEKETRDILISEQTAKRLKVKIGEKLIVHFVKDKDSIKRSFEISGIYRTGLEEYDVKFVFVDLRLLQNILSWDANQIGGYEIFIENIEDAEIIADYIYEEILPANLYAQTIRDKFEGLFKWIELQDLNAMLLLVLMGIVAVINMCTAILILILERSKMIGTLKAMGMGNWGIRKIFIYNAFWILSMALLLGNALGIGMAFLQKQTGVLKLDETNYYLSEVPIHFDMVSILAVNVLTVLVTLLVMIIPSYMVTKISPIKILRFD